MAEPAHQVKLIPLQLKNWEQYHEVDNTMKYAQPDIRLEFVLADLARVSSKDIKLKVRIC